MLRRTLAATATTRMLREIVQAALARENRQRMERFNDRTLPDVRRQAYEPKDA